MKKNNIQILFSDEEIEEIENKARENDLTIVSYIRSVVLDSDNFVSSYNLLKIRINELEVGKKFTLKLLFGVDWSMSKGTKISLGKTFHSKVQRSEIDNVELLCKDSSNTWWYVKK